MGDIFDMFIRMNIRTAAEIRNIESEMIENVNSFKRYTDGIRKQILQAENNHNKPIFPNTQKSRSSKRLVETSSSDDEIDVSSTRVQLHNVSENSENPGTSSKPKRGAAKAASENIKKVSNMKLNTKMRRPTNEEISQTSVFEILPSDGIKKEKLSEPSVIEESAKLTVLTDVTNENMPPPTLKPKRGRRKVKKETEESDTSTERVTRSTRSARTNRTKIKEETNEAPRTTKNTSVSPRRKDSDVLIQEVPVTIVVLTDSESEVDKNVPETEEIVVEKKEKVTRGKKPKKQTQNKMKLKIKEEKLPAQEVQEVQEVQEEVKNNTQNSVQEVSVYEDALSENKSLDDKLKPVNVNLNETHVINKNVTTNISKMELSPAITNKIKETGVQLNCTVVLETIQIPREQNLNDTKILPNKQIPNINNLLTDDDESFEAPVKTPIKKQPVKTKPIFSPYGNSPVKKRVAEFEKLTTADVPARVTRTKTRNLAGNAENLPQATPLQQNRAIVAPSTKSKKPYTPLTSNKLPSMIPQSESKLKVNKNTSVLSEAPVKSLTAVKASRAELQGRREEEQKRKLEYELEVKRKKEAMLQAKIEEQKRKREEKQMKVQKAREAKEREKEEKIRRIIQEKEEKLQKEEQMKREWMNTMAKKAAEEEKRQQMLKQEKLEQKRKLNMKPPPLPTDDLQDTDDEEENPKHKYVGPLWSQRQNLYPTLYTQRYIPTAITKEFFQMKAQTPNLLDIFETVHADILRRNSSAVWRTPPRYSTLPKF